MTKLVAFPLTHCLNVSLCSSLSPLVVRLYFGSFCAFLYPVCSVVLRWVQGCFSSVFLHIVSPPAPILTSKVSSTAVNRVVYKPLLIESGNSYLRRISPPRPVTQCCSGAGLPSASSSWRALSPLPPSPLPDLPPCPPPPALGGEETQSPMDVQHSSGGGLAPYLSRSTQLGPVKPLWGKQNTAAQPGLD